MFCATCGVTFISRHPPRTLGVVCLVRSYRHPIRARQLFQHHPRGAPLRGPVGLKHFAHHDQSVPILDREIPVIAQLGFLSAALPRQKRIRIGSGLVRFVRPLLRILCPRFNRFQRHSFNTRRSQGIRNIADVSAAKNNLVHDKPSNATTEI